MSLGAATSSLICSATRPFEPLRHPLPCAGGCCLWRLLPFRVPGVYLYLSFLFFFLKTDNIFNSTFNYRLITLLLYQDHHTTPIHTSVTMYIPSAQTIFTAGLAMTGCITTKSASSCHRHPNAHDLTSPPLLYNLVTSNRGRRSCLRQDSRFRRREVH